MKGKSVFGFLLIFLFLIFEYVIAVEETKIENDETTTEIVSTTTTEIDTLTTTEKVSTKTTERASKETVKSSEGNTDSNDNKETDDNLVINVESTHTPISELWDTVSTDNLYTYIYCLYDREPQCKIFKSQMKKVLKSIEKAIEIKETVTMSLFLMDLTYLCGDCLGIVLPPSFIYVKEIGTNKVYSVPQALARQLKIDGVDMDSFPEVDFTMVINVDQDDEDIERFGHFALAREVLHGMGIMTSGDLVNSNDYDLFTEDFYAPQRVPIITLDNDDVDGVYVKFKRFYPISIYEKYIVAQANPNEYLFDSLNDMFRVQYPKQSYNFMKATEEIEKKALIESYEPFLSSPYYEQAKKIGKLYKQKGSVGFRATDGTIIPLQTFNDEYIKSYSITHIDIPKVQNFTFYDYDPFNINEIKDYLNEDFILNYTYMFMYDLDTVKSIVAKDNKYGIISPNILKMLTTLGWKEKGSSDSSSSQTAQVQFKVASDVDIEYDNYYDLLMKNSDLHDYYGYSLANNLVCDPKAYALTLLAIGLTFFV